MRENGRVYVQPVWLRAMHLRTKQDQLDETAADQNHRAYQNCAEQNANH